MFHINHKLIAKYRASELSNEVLDHFFVFVGGMIVGVKKDLPIEESIHDFQWPSRGPCIICGQTANLLGNICYNCMHKK